MNRIIKMEEEEYPLSSPDHDHAFFNHCLTTFYDHDSEDIIHAKCSVQDVLCFLDHSVDICDTPLPEIMQLVAQNEGFRGVDETLVRQKIIKQKNLLKRNRAKNRRALPKKEIQIIDLAVDTCEKVEEYKKQRNRISAQVSRDKKKEKVKALEELNHQLQRQCERQKLENEKLRQEILTNNQSSYIFPDPSAPSGEKIKNKFTQLLILLGLIFLFGLIKDIFNSETAESLSLAKIEPIKATSFQLQSESFFTGSSKMGKAEILASVEETLTQVLESRSAVTRIKEKIVMQMQRWKQAPLGLTKKAREQIEILKKEA